jgi:hypothetical protein
MSTLVFLGLHPDEQQTAYEEIRKEIPSADSMVKMSLVSSQRV